MDYLLDPESKRLTPQMALELTRAAQAPERITECRLYDDCLKHVRNAAQQGKASCIFKVPFMMLGFPLYKVTFMRDALAFRFQKEGWKVSVKDEGLLQLEWETAGQGRGTAKGGKGRAKTKAPASAGGAGLSADTLRLLKKVQR